MTAAEREGPVYRTKTDKGKASTAEVSQVVPLSVQNNSEKFANDLSTNAEKKPMATLGNGLERNLWSKLQCWVKSTPLLAVFTNFA